MCIIPDPLYFLNFVVDTMTVKIYLPDVITDYSIYDIDTGSVLINNSAAPVAYKYITIDTAGDMLMISVDYTDFLSTYPTIWGVTPVEYSISGLLLGGSVFNEIDTVTIISHRPGDINADGEVGVLDIACLIAYI